jgi:2,3-bisphosphoglycerate-independent phosphoglycerate mutase
MSRYNTEFSFPVAFPPQPMTNVLAEWLSKHEVKQAHVAGMSLFVLFSFCSASIFFVSHPYLSFLRLVA